jgi:hypothetical protein
MLATETPPTPRNRAIINSLLQASDPKIDDVYMTTAELAERHRMQTSTLDNLRYRGEGIPYTKLPSGTVLYKLRDVLEAERQGSKGFSWRALNDALALMSDLEPADREAIVAHLKKTMR